MRKIFALLLVLGLVVAGQNTTFAQDSANTEGEQVEQVDSNTSAPVDAEPTNEPEPMEAGAEESEAPKAAEEASGHQLVKQRFIEGGWEFMTLVLICLILGLALCIERIITLNIATVNTDKLLNKIQSSVNSGDIKGAIETCKATPGPTAEVLEEGLKRVEEGIEKVEGAVVSSGGVQVGVLEKGLSWIGLFIAIAPMLGFMGTVLGMIGAFDSIVEAGELSATAIAGDIKVALLTTVFGLIVAIILQIFYNYIVSKVDGIVNKMEDASIGLINILLDAEQKKKV